MIWPLTKSTNWLTFSFDRMWNSCIFLLISSNLWLYINFLFRSSDENWESCTCTLLCFAKTLNTKDQCYSLIFSSEFIRWLIKVSFSESVGSLPMIKKGLIDILNCFYILLKRDRYGNLDWICQFVIFFFFFFFFLDRFYRLVRFKFSLDLDI